ncbi:hypothetical protein ACFVYE_31990 [Streptomyces sp. NPDC058239]|uniref:hypothetical protein n=1 Tax=Streptomyces sp. NPDC058239 TaxID=3346395 RepID=UPI0036E7C47A
MGIFHDPMRAGIAIIRALAGLDPRTPGAPTVARLAILTDRGDEIMRIELTEAGVENAVTVLEDAADRAAQDAHLAALEPSQWSAAAVAHTHPQIYADVQDLFDGIDPQDLLDDVFNSQDADASLVAYEQLVTGEWDGDVL